MAIKTSNQITFTEQKKILEIKEWYLATDKNANVTLETIGWTEEVQIINETNKYLWNYEEVIYSIGSSEKSEPIIIGFYGKGIDGKGIADIKNYYFITQSPELPENPDWSETVLMLTPTDKYLWNYDKIVYTDNTFKNTDPAIIGVYGDSGTDAVDFQIYSTDGFEFSDDLKSITLKTVAFQGGTAINGVSYVWEWWNKGSTEDDKYTVISNATASSLVVQDTDPHALCNIKCKMTYDNITYEDHVSLTKKTEMYTAIAKFFDGDNTIGVDDVSSVIYVELYKDNEIIEELGAETFYKNDNNVIDGDYITTNITGADEEKKYFACYNSSKQYYDVVLGEYSTSSKKWKIIKNSYVYKNSFNDSILPVIYIPKEKINKSLNISFDVCDNDDNVIAFTHTRVIDLNDPIVSASAPQNPVKGQIWLDTSSDPDILKVWDGSKWTNSNYQKGNVVYTSKPSSYSKGDLWILAPGETCASFGEGCMLRSNTTSTSFSSSHWEDVDEEATKQKNNIKQYFDFNKSSGLKVGQSDDKFYVNISSTEMGFYDAEDGDPEKVVSIGNKSATIKDMTVDEGAKFNCEVQFGNFIWKTESNGSLSLALAN